MFQDLEAYALQRLQNFFVDRVSTPLGLQIPRTITPLLPVFFGYHAHPVPLLTPRYVPNGLGHNTPTRFPISDLRQTTTPRVPKPTSALPTAHGPRLLRRLCTTPSRQLLAPADKGSPEGTVGDLRRVQHKLLSLRGLGFYRNRPLLKKCNGVYL